MRYSDALISECGRYRWWLAREWSDIPTSHMVCWVMLNPSTADATTNDATIRKCIGFSQRWGFGGMWVVNLFPLRATDPMDLYDPPRHGSPSEYVRAATANDKHILSISKTANRVICAWGDHGTLLFRGREVTHMLRKEGVDLWCLGTTKKRQPKHPGRIGYDTPLITYLEDPCSNEPVKESAASSPGTIPKSRRVRGRSRST